MIILEEAAYCDPGLVRRRKRLPPPQPTDLSVGCRRPCLSQVSEVVVPLLSMSNSVLL